MKVLNNIYFVLNFTYNLLTLGQLRELSYNLHFKDDNCVNRNKNKRMPLITISKLRRKRFPIKILELLKFVILVRMWMSFQFGIKSIVI